MNEKTNSIDNFIGIYDNYITHEECDKAIEHFNLVKKFNQTLDRKKFEGAPSHVKKDEQAFLMPNNIETWWENLKNLIFNFDIAFKNYCEVTGAEGAYNQEFFYTDLKIQKTLPGEGYHIWHVEHGGHYSQQNRAFVYSIYLNDVEEGGETEFLNFSKRVKAKKGRIAIWPAGFPYVHRGNPPLSGEKYLLTSWMKLTPRF